MGVISIVWADNVLRPSSSAARSRSRASRCHAGQAAELGVGELKADGRDAPAEHVVLVLGELLAGELLPGMIIGVIAMIRRYR
jgi:hypothetical protein